MFCGHGCSWMLSLVIGLISSYTQKETIKYQCSISNAEPCHVYRYTGCSPYLLWSHFPELFPRTSDREGGYWPGAPQVFNGKEIVENNTKTIRLKWVPPTDSSINALRGFFLTMSTVDGHSTGMTYCYVIKVQNTSKVSIQDVFTLDIPYMTGVFTSHFRLHSLPLPDPLLEKEVQGYSKTLVIQSAKSLEKSPADWTARQLNCSLSEMAAMHISFILPPASFHFRRFDITLRYLNTHEDKALDITREQRYVNYSTSTQSDRYISWNISAGELIETGKYEVGITPVDVVTFKGCLCHDGGGVCVGGCRTSLCFVNILSKRSDVQEHHESIGLHVYISVPTVLVISVVLAIVLFTLHKRFYPSIFSDSSSSRNDDVISTDNLQVNNQKDRYTKVDPNGHNIEWQSFIKPQPERDVDVMSVTLSEQMLKINEMYLMRHEPEDAKRYFIEINETTSLGGKSV